MNRIKAKGIDVMKECIAMILAGGQGSRLGALTQKAAKPAITFGAKYKIIDFVLSNLANSAIDTVGILTQYKPYELSTHIGNGVTWSLNNINGGVYILPPYTADKKSEWYRGTANAVYQNLDFIERFDPRYVLILSGDHIYKMDYDAMLSYHKAKKADATIAVINVDISEASRFGIMSVESGGKISDFEEKPENPKSTLASMGVYIFNYDVLKKYLAEDEISKTSQNDFGKNIIPKMLTDGSSLFAYRFDGYWRDVGTVQSLWQANMDLLKNPPLFNLSSRETGVICKSVPQKPFYAGKNAKILNSIISEGSTVCGEVNNSLISDGVVVSENAEINNSIIMQNVKIKDGAVINKAIIGNNTVIGKNAAIGVAEGSKENVNDMCVDNISVVGFDAVVSDNKKYASNSMIY